MESRFYYYFMTAVNYCRVKRLGSSGKKKKLYFDNISNNIAITIIKDKNDG